MVECLICEKECKQFKHMEFDFVICNKCYDKLYPYLVRQAVLGNERSILMEAKYHGRREY
jgi:hypothetical protein